MHHRGVAGQVCFTHSGQLRVGWRRMDCATIRVETITGDYTDIACPDPAQTG